MQTDTRRRTERRMPFNRARSLLCLMPLLVSGMACNRTREALGLHDAGSSNKGEVGRVEHGNGATSASSSTQTEAPTHAGDDVAPSRERGPSSRCPTGMALVTGETLEMGSAQDWAYGATDPLWEKVLESTKPAHRVEVASFCIDVAPVSVASYQECVAKGACTRAAEKARATIDDKSRDCNWRRNGYEGYPANCADREQASRYCAQNNARLPTEAEWELAARGTLEHLDKDLAKQCNGSDITEATCPIALYSMYRSAFGVYGMMLTEEWTSSPYCKYPSHDCKSSKGAVRGRVLDTDWERTLARWARAPSEKLRTLTFRCAADAPGR